METAMLHPITQDRIEVRAYELFLSRGCEDGHDIEDWLAAESELTALEQTSNAGVAAPADAEPAADGNP
jgi:hypothetical protein